MPNPKVVYPVLTTFGRRIAELKNDKMRVAEKVVSLFMGSGTSAFIGDGSSTFYVGLELFEQKRQATVWTNHLGIAHEFAVWNSPQGELPETFVTLAEGAINANLMMTGGGATARFAAAQSARALNVVLSVKQLFSEQGPAGSDQESLEVKQVACSAAMPSGRKIIFVADYSKLCAPCTNATPLVYPASRDWDGVVRQPNVFVVTTRHPEVHGIVELPRNPVTELDWYRYHSFKLRKMMGARYVEVP